MDFTAENWKKTFAMVWVGQAFSLIGSQTVSFAITWWLTQATGSAAVLVAMTLCGTIPGVVLGPFIGALVDRWNRQKVMILADGIIAAFTMALAILFMVGQAQVWFLYAMAFIRGTLGTFHWSAMQASTSLMVPENQLSRVAGLNQTLNGVLTIAAPPLGALVVALLPMGQIMLIDVATAALAISTLLLVRIPQPKNVSQEQVSFGNVFKDVRSGLAYITAWPGLMVILGMAMVINFLNNPTGTLMPLLVTRHFQGGAWHLSAIESAFGFGIIAGGLLLSVWGGFKRKVITMIVFLVVMGSSQLLIGGAPQNFFWLAVAGSALGGLSGPMVNGPLFALVQAKVKPEIQGRVFTMIGSLAGIMAPLGLAVSAPVADHLGIQVWWWLGGIACVLIAVIGLLIKPLQHMEDEPLEGENAEIEQPFNLAEVK